MEIKQLFTSAWEESLSPSPIRTDESGRLVDQSTCAHEQVYGGNERLHLFGKTRVDFISRRKKRLKQQHGGCWPRFSGRGEAARTRASISSAGSLQREPRKLCSHLHTACISSGWAARLQTRADGAALAFVFGERWEGNQWRCGGEAGAGEHCPGTELEHPTPKPPGHKSSWEGLLNPSPS